MSRNLVYNRAQYRSNLEEAVGRLPGQRTGGYLNPTWIEWLMGLPLGWTSVSDLADSETPLSPRSLNTSEEG